MTRARSLLLALCLTACSRREVSIEPEPRASASADQAESEGASAKPAPPLPETKLLDSGNEPRAALGFRVARDAAATLRFTVRMPPREPLRLIVEARVPSVTPGGEARCEIRVTGVEALDGGPSDGDGLVGFHGFAITTSRGAVVKRRLHNQGLLVGHVIEPAFNQWLGDLAPVFPAEPIGVGARWQVERRISKQLYEADETVVYKLAALEGRRATLEVEAAQSAGPQPMYLVNPLLREHAYLLEMKGHGTARLDVDLDGLPLAFGHSLVEGEGKADFTRNDETSHHELKNRIELDVER